MRAFRTLLERKIWERRQTLEEFAAAAEVFAREHGEAGTIGVRHLQRLVAGRGPGGRPLGAVRPATARLLERMFGASVEELLAPVAADKPVVQELDVQAASGSGLADLVGWLPDVTQRRVAARLEVVDLGEVRDRGARLRDVGRSELARTLSEYYGHGDASHSLYAVEVAGRRVLASVLTRSDWVTIGVLMEPGADRFELVDAELPGALEVDAHGVRRIAEAAALGVRITNKPLYRLVDVDVRASRVAGHVALMPFGAYALTMDLLESELAASLTSGRPADLPSRDRLLPDLASVLDVGGRICAGGVVALTAIARPSDPSRGPADYALLVQERSGQVLNAAGRLAVIPKGFHEPLTDFRADVSIGSTLRREMEEELFGRVEVDSTAGAGRAAAPMHSDRLSAPMRWLLDSPGRLRAECTGFGLNLVSGNYEFAALVVIEDEEFWPRFGGQIEANWESAGLRVYSSVDDHLVSKLIFDGAWSNEGLFSFLQGIRRLGETGGSRVRLPEVRLLTASER